MVLDILVKNHNFRNQLTVLVVTIELITFVALHQINVSCVLFFLRHDLLLCFCNILVTSKRRVVQHTWTGVICLIGAKPIRTKRLSRYSTAYSHSFPIKHLPSVHDPGRHPRFNRIVLIITSYARMIRIWIIIWRRSSWRCIQQRRG
jgi:hypothetical protein